MGSCAGEWSVIEWRKELEKLEFDDEDGKYDGNKYKSKTAI